MRSATGKKSEFKDFINEMNLVVAHPARIRSHATLPVAEIARELLNINSHIR